MASTERPKTERRKKSTAPAMAADTANDSGRISQTDIALRAFSYYCERGYQHGSDVEDWLRAERELAPSAPAKAAKARTLR